MKQREPLPQGQPREPLTRAVRGPVSGKVRAACPGAGTGLLGGLLQTFLIFLMSLSSSLGVTVWVDWMRSLSLSRDAICNRRRWQW